MDGLEAAALDVGHDIMFQAKPALIGIAAWVASQQRENRHLPLVRPDTTSWASSFSSAAFSSALAALDSSKGVNHQLALDDWKHLCQRAAPGSGYARAGGGLALRAQLGQQEGCTVKNTQHMRSARRDHPSRATASSCKSMCTTSPASAPAQRLHAKPDEQQHRQQVIQGQPRVGNHLRGRA